MNKKIIILSTIFCLVILIGCTVAALINFVLSIGIVGFVCNEMFPNDQSLIQSDDGSISLTAANLCDSIVSLVLQTAAGTIEVRNENGKWITLTSSPEQFDLLQLQGKQKVMVFKELPQGKYDKLRVDLDSVKIKTKNGKTYTTILPNKELILDINIEVINNQKTTVELNLDIAKSLHRTEENKIVFVPVMNIESRKNVNVQVLDQNKRLINVNDGTLLDNRNVGMDLNGEMRQNFVLSRNLDLSVKNNKVVSSGISKTGTKINPPITSTQKYSQPSNKITQTNKISTLAVSTTQINSEPSGAEVKINGILKGVTPINIQFTSGIVLLKLSKYGYKTYQSFVNVGENGLITDFGESSEQNGKHEQISQSEYRITLNK